MAEDSGQFDGCGEVELLAVTEIERPVGEVNVAMADPAGLDAKKDLRSLRGRGRLDDLVSGALNWVSL